MSLLDIAALMAAGLTVAAVLVIRWMRRDRRSWDAWVEGWNERAVIAQAREAAELARPEREAARPPRRVPRAETSGAPR